MIRAHEESDTKSKRTRDAMRRKVKAWDEGTSRATFRSGRSPSWLTMTDGQWQFIPARVVAVREAIALYREGAGAHIIAEHLKATRQTFGSGDTTAARVLRVLASENLIGERHTQVDGATTVLQGFLSGDHVAPRVGRVARASQVARPQACARRHPEHLDRLPGDSLRILQ